jgi:enediyne biosynthesis protein E4
MRRLIPTVWMAGSLLVAAAFVQPERRSETKPGNGPIVFENSIGRSAITFVMNNSVSALKHQVETMLAGVAVFDYNNDGLMDLYFANGASLPGMDKSDPRYWNRLYRNNGDGTFTDVTEAAGVRGAGFAMGVAAADYDNDGWVDLYVTGVNRNQLFHNNGDGTFTDVTEKAGVAGIYPKSGKPWSISAGWFDYDNDGKLDLFVANYVNWSLKDEQQCKVGGINTYCSPNNYTGEPNMLFHNNGDGTFTDVSEQSGIGKITGKGMGIAFADYDGDGFTDIFVSNDTYRNFLFHNERDGTFREVGILAGIAYNDTGKSIAGMGADFRDVDNDGRPDIFVAGMVGDTFPVFLNRGGNFLDVTSSWGVAVATAGVTAWGSGIVDFDNDGWKDLFVSCASILDNSEEIDHLPSKLPSKVLWNTGRHRFVDVSAAAGSSFRVPRAHRGVAFGDLNNDGRIDAVVTNQNSLPEIFMNRSPGANHWLMVKLVGTRSNRDGLGARLKVTPAGGQPIYNHATTSTGFGASSDPRVHFGLGKSARVDEIEIWWPSGIRQTLRGVSADQILVVHEPVE